MNDKTYEIIDGKIHPRKDSRIVSHADEISGDYWKIWKEGLRCFLEYDEGHFASKMVTIEISEDDYSLISSKPAAVVEVINSTQS